MNDIQDEPWEQILRWRMLSATASVQALKTGKRRDTARVLRVVEQAADGLSFHCAVNPDRASGFVVETLRDILAGHIEELGAMLERAAEKARRDADDEDGGYAPH